MAKIEEALINTKTVLQNIESVVHTLAAAMNVLGLGDESDVFIWVHILLDQCCYKLI